MKIIKSDFLSDNVRCDGDLYLPAGITNPPVVIMAHGLGGQKDFRLEAFAKRFVEKQMAVFLFDYRTFGKSDGEPRQLVDPVRHVEDWRAAIAHIRTLSEIDNTRIALWGSSFSGGHVIKCASEDKEIRAVVSQVPFVSGWSSMQLKSFSDIFLASMYGTYDAIKSFLYLSPHYSPLLAQPGSFAAMNTEDSYDGYMSVVPEESTWENKMQSRGFLKMTFYSPWSKADQIKAPTLVMPGRHDSLIPLDAVEAAAKELPNGELVIMDCGHFDPYTGEMFEEFIKRQIAFLEKYLRGRGVFTPRELGGQIFNLDN